MDTLESRLALLPLPPTGGGPMLIGVSGGLDSMLLLNLLHHRLSGTKLHLIAAHLNHQLRGSSADADERLVREECRKLKVRCVTARTDVAQLARKEHLSIEVAARRTRHDFLARTAGILGVHIIALAHHRDDQVELFFLRLLRGASPSGLAGMTCLAPSSANPQLTLWRPLLEFDRAELNAYAVRAGIRWREDQSNADEKYLRNRVRHSLLPKLRREFQASLNAVLERTMITLGDESALVRELAQAWLKDREPESFEKLPTAVQRVVVELQLIAGGAEPSFDLIETLRLHPARDVSVGDNGFVQRTREGKVVLRKGALGDFDTSQIFCELPGGAIRSIQIQAFGGGTLQFHRTAPPKLAVLRKSTSKMSAQAGLAREFFDADKIGPRFALRHWRPGDRFQPMGMKQPVKLQNLFVNAKIPAQQRRALVVAEAANGDLFWVENLRISERFKLDSTTRQALKWHWKR